MRLNIVEAKAGYQWFRQGIWLFYRYPLSLLSIFLAYLCVMMVLSLIPRAGSIMPLLFIPGASIVFMAASRQAIAGKSISLTMLITSFRAYSSAVVRELLLMGLLYIVALFIVFAASSLADGGLLMRLVIWREQIDRNALVHSNLPLTALIATVVYTPIAMLFWFAPTLSAWHSVPWYKAFFFSWVACWRNRNAFLVYLLFWSIFGFLVFSALAVLAHLLGIDLINVLMSFLILLTAMFYCSFYATYLGCFNNADTPK